VKSLSYAQRGLARVLAEEANFRIQMVVAVAVLAAAWYLGLSVFEKAVLVLAIALVLVLELLNSALERVVDILKPRIHHYVEEMKDIAAGAVLIASVASVVIGALIFWPYVKMIFTGA
jgi:undecaprenol kinase